jgi:hypothetical protein
VLMALYIGRERMDSRIQPNKERGEILKHVFSLEKKKKRNIVGWGIIAVGGRINIRAREN